LILEPPYPNPANPATTIAWAQPTDGSVRIEVYDVLGRCVRTLVDRHYSAGRYTVVWDGLDGSGRAVGSSVYFVKAAAGEVEQTRRMLVVR
jgi:flagellar hook assembly protein FlgD